MALIEFSRGLKNKTGIRVFVLGHITLGEFFSQYYKSGAYNFSSEGPEVEKGYVLRCLQSDIEDFGFCCLSADESKVGKAVGYFPKRKYELF